MADADGWEPVSGGSFIKWEGYPVDGVVIGTYLGSREGEFGPIGEVMTEQGKVAFGMNTKLRGDMANVAVGQEVRIQYLGKAKTKAGKLYHNFHVAQRTPEKVPF